MKISVLDQSPVKRGGTAEQALKETLALARLADELGYHRFWVSEHHSTAAYAGSAPEVLVAAIGAQTSRIRIGTGGIMLPHYSTFKVAEVASLLGTLFPGRVDLGVGRAPGSEMATARELAHGGTPRFHLFPQQTEELMAKLADHRYRPKITPRPETNPDIWMLGTSVDSARLAAKLGLPYNFALFINPDMDQDILRVYKESFQPSAWLDKPYAGLTVNVYCADTEQKARQLARARQLSMLRVVTRQGFSGIGSIEECEQYPFSDDELHYIQHRGRLDAVGTPEQVRARLEDLAEQFEADELMTVTITYDFEDRLQSYRLLAEALEISG
ncbi:MAG: LLM class flavin-dependent oxidoreductase [Porticoccaceae bacterium]|nr:LLM class flavin-dependent oxidoreductase [Porticoccaceae bacterium]